MLDSNNSNSNNKLHHVVKNKLRLIAIRANNHMTLNLQTIDYVARMNRLFDKFLEEELLLNAKKTTNTSVVKRKKKKKKQKTQKNEVATDNDDLKNSKKKETTNVAGGFIANENDSNNDDTSATGASPDDSCDVRKIIENRRQQLLSEEISGVKKVGMKVQNLVDGTCERVRPCKTIRSRRCHRRLRRRRYDGQDGIENDNDDDEQSMMNQQEALYMKQILNEFLQEVQNDSTDNQKANNVDTGSKKSASMVRLGSMPPSTSIQKAETSSNQEQHLPLKDRFQHFLQRRASTTGGSSRKKKKNAAAVSGTKVNNDDNIEESVHIDDDDDPDHGMTTRMKDILSKFLESQEVVATVEESAAATSDSAAIAVDSDTASAKGIEQDTKLGASDVKGKNQDIKLASSSVSVSASETKTARKTTKESLLLDSFSPSTKEAADSNVKKSRLRTNQNEDTVNTKTLKEDGGKSLRSSKTTSPSSFLPFVGRRGSKNEDEKLVLSSLSQQNREVPPAAVAGSERVMGVATNLYDNRGWLLLVIPLLLLYALAVLGFLRKKRKAAEMEEETSVKQNIRSLFTSPSFTSTYSSTAVPDAMELVDGETPPSSKIRRTIYSDDLMDEMSAGNPPSGLFRQRSPSTTTIEEAESQSSGSSNTIDKTSRKDITLSQTRSLEEEEVVPSLQFSTSPSSVDTTTEQPPTHSDAASAEIAVPRVAGPENVAPKSKKNSDPDDADLPMSLFARKAGSGITATDDNTKEFPEAQVANEMNSITNIMNDDNDDVAFVGDIWECDKSDKKEITKHSRLLRIETDEDVPCTKEKEYMLKNVATTDETQDIPVQQEEEKEENCFETIRGETEQCPKSKEEEMALTMENTHGYENHPSTTSKDVHSPRHRKREIEDFARQPIRLHSNGEEPLEPTSMDIGTVEDNFDSQTPHRWRGTVSVPIPDDESCESSLTSSLAPHGMVDSAESRSYDAEDEAMEDVPDNMKPLGSQAENLLRFGMSFGRLLLEAEEEMEKLEDEEDPELEYEMPREKYRPSDASMRLNVNLEELLAEGEDETFDASLNVSGFGNRSLASSKSSKAMASFGKSVKKLIRETETTLADLHIEEESSVDSFDIESMKGQPVAEKAQTDSAEECSTYDDSTANLQLRGNLDTLRRDSMLGFGMSFARLLRESDGMMDDVQDEEDPEEEYEVESRLSGSTRRKSSVLLSKTLTNLLAELSSDERLIIERDMDDDHCETEAEDSLMPLLSQAGTGLNSFMGNKGQATERKKSDTSAKTSRRSRLRKEQSLRFESSLEKLLEETEEGVFGRSSHTLNLTGGVHKCTHDA